MEIDNIKNLIKDYKNLIKLSIWIANKWAVKFNFSNYKIDEKYISVFEKENHVLVYLEKEDKTLVIKLLIPFKAFKDTNCWLDTLYNLSTNLDKYKRTEIFKAHKDEKDEKTNHFKNLNIKEVVNEE